MSAVLRTFALFAVLTLIFIGIGYLIGFFVGDPTIFMIIFLSIALLINIAVYFVSDKLVLSMYRARIVSESEAPKLHSIVEELASDAGIPKPKVAIVPIDTPNAFATGRNPKNAVVAVTEGLLRRLNDRELRAVIGHELGHIKHRDMLVMTVAATITSALAIGARMFLWNAMFSRDREDSFALIIMFLAALGAAIAATLVKLAISRQREYYADEFSAKLTGRPRDLISALIKISDSVKRRPLTDGNPATASLFIVNPFRGGTLINLFSTHPPLEKRIENLKKIEMDLY